jgi:autotransporter-associated beta strand protein
VDPNSASSGAKFGSTGVANTSVTLDADRTVGQLLFSSNTAYTIGGSNTLTLDNGASAASITLQGAATQTISAPITLSSDLTVTGFNGGTVVLGALTGATKNLTANVTGSTVTLTGANTYNNTTIASGVILNVGNGGGTGSLGSGTTTNAGTLNFNRTGNLSVGSIISGAGSVNQVGSGMTTFTSANDYTGTTSISNGTLQLSGSGTLGATTSTLGAIASGAVLDLNGTNQAVAGFSGSSAGQIQNNSGSGTSILTVGGGSASTFAGVIADNNTLDTGGKVGLALTGTGAVTLSGSNSFSGGFTLGSGSTVTLGTTNATGSGGIPTTSQLGIGVLTINGGRISGGVGNLNGGTSNSQIIVNADFAMNLTARSLFAGAWELGNATRTISSNRTNTAANAIAGGGNTSWGIGTLGGAGVSSVSNGTMYVTRDSGATNPYVSFRISDNPAFIGNAGLQIGSGVIANVANSDIANADKTKLMTLTVDSGGYFNTGESGIKRDVAVSSLSGAGDVGNLTTGAASTSNLTIDGGVLTSTTTFSGKIVDTDTVLNGASSNGKVALTKSGSTTQILSGANTYTGATTVSGGTLLIGTSGSLANTDVTVGGVGSSGTPTLGGGGSIGGATSIAAAGSGVVGAHAVGVTGVSNGVGTQTFTSTLDYGSGSIFEWNLQAIDTADIGVVADGATGTYDKVIASGAANSVTGSGAIFKIVLGGNAFTDAFWNTDKTWTDIFSGTGAPANLASIFTTFGGSNVNTDGTVTGRIGNFTFNGSSTLTWSAVPEPSSALAGLLIAAGLLRRRRSA